MYKSALLRHFWAIPYLNEPKQQKMEGHINQSSIYAGLKRIVIRKAAFLLKFYTLRFSFIAKPVFMRDCTMLIDLRPHYDWLWIDRPGWL